MVRLSSIVLAGAALVSPLVSAVQEVEIDGAEFVVKSSGDRLPIIGVTYQPGGSSGVTETSDPLSDATTCLRDAILLQQLGVNTIRVYNLAANVDHSACVSIFNAAGIYLILDVNSVYYGEYINRADPSSTYTLAYLQHIFTVVTNFWSFPNVLGFFAGNEILNEESSSDAPAYIRAVVRDLKEYIALHAPRSIPVGYSAADVSTMLTDTWNYLGCTLENSTYSKMDFFGLNDYEWCGDSSYTISGYDNIVSEFKGTDIPVFFSEYGCITPRPRNFTNVPVLYGDKMTELSGGLVYEYSQESNDYGIVSINSTTEVTLLVDYTYLWNEYRDIEMSVLTTNQASLTSVATTSCASSLITESTFLAEWDLPSRPSGGDALITSGVTSASTYTLTSVTATTMPASITVLNYTGATITSLTLSSLPSTIYNTPGLVAKESLGSTGSGSSGSGAAGPWGNTDLHAVTILGSVLAGFVGLMFVL